MASMGGIPTTATKFVVAQGVVSPLWPPNRSGPQGWYPHCSHQIVVASSGGIPTMASLLQCSWRHLPPGHLSVEAQWLYYTHKKQTMVTIITIVFT
jgi:hypothetical protein